MNSFASSMFKNALTDFGLFAMSFWILQKKLKIYQLA
jgi:hypothetical protein